MENKIKNKYIKAIIVLSILLLTVVTVIISTINNKTEALVLPGKDGNNVDVGTDSLGKFAEYAIQQGPEAFYKITSSNIVGQKFATNRHNGKETLQFESASCLYHTTINTSGAIYNASDIIDINSE